MLPAKVQTAAAIKRSVRLETDGLRNPNIFTYVDN
jgi:hypothetical protein